jgi:hypothetical protein
MVGEGPGWAQTARDYLDLGATARMDPEGPRRSYSASLAWASS